MNDNTILKPIAPPLEEHTSYQIENKTFIVESIFSKESKETLGAILVRLMKSDIADS